MPGRVLGAATSGSVGETIGFYYTSSTVTQAIYVATFPMLITDVRLRIRVGSTSGTATIYKAPSGTAAASGTQLTGSIDLSATPTADTTIIVPLLGSAGMAGFTMAPGDSIAVVIAGTMTNGVGVLQVYVEPLT